MHMILEYRLVQQVDQTCADQTNVPEKLRIVVTHAKTYELNPKYFSDYDLRVHLSSLELFSKAAQTSSSLFCLELFNIGSKNNTTSNSNNSSNNTNSSNQSSSNQSSSNQSSSNNKYNTSAQRFEDLKHAKEVPPLAGTFCIFLLWA